LSRKKVSKKVSEPWGVAAPTYDGGPTGAATTVKEHAMSTIEDFHSATFAAIPHEDLTVAEAWASSPLGAPSVEDFPSATFAAIPHEDLTVGEAWASSPLGDPSIEDGFLSEPANVEDFPPTTVTAVPRSRGTNVLVGAAVVAGLGVVAGLCMMAVNGTGSKQEKPAVVVPNSSVGSVTPQSPSAIAPPPVAPAPPSIATPPNAAQLPSGPV